MGVYAKNKEETFWRLQGRVGWCRQEGSASAASARKLMDLVQLNMTELQSGLVSVSLDFMLKIPGRREPWPLIAPLSPMACRVTEYRLFGAHSWSEPSWEVMGIVKY